MSPSSSAPGDSEAREVEVPLAMASDEERLAEKSFAAMEPHELAQLRRLMTRLELATPQRRSRRARRARHGQRLDLRRTLRASLRTGVIRSLSPAAAGGPVPEVGAAVRHLGLDGALRTCPSAAVELGCRREPPQRRSSSPPD